MIETLTTRVERCLDRWNALRRQGRSELSSKAVSVSLGLSELGKLHRTLSGEVQQLEEALDRVEAKEKA